MTIFKVLGAVLLLLVGAGVGWSLVLFERRRYRQLAGFVALLRLMRMRIDCFTAPLCDIFASLDGEVRDACGVTGAPNDFKELLRQTRLYVPREARGLFFEMAALLGGGDKSEQVRCCEYYIGALLPMLDRARGELPKRERVALLFPLFCAAVLVLLLL